MLAISCVFASDLPIESFEDDSDLKPSGNERLFTLSSDSGEIVLIYSTYGVNTGIKPTFTLYGDGRVAYQEYYIGGSLFQLLKEDEFHLEYNEMEELLHRAVDHGLMEATEESVRKKVGRGFHVNDCGDSSIEIHLTSYRINGKKRVRRQNRIVLHCPEYLSSTRDVSEYHGFRAVAEILWRLHRGAKESKRAPSP